MTALHAKGIVHCDIKMGNILLDAEFNPVFLLLTQKIADFGHAVKYALEPEDRNRPGRLDDHSDFFRQRGALYYQSPEQLKGTSQWLTPKIDCWALGIVFYCILEGKHPFKDPGEDPEVIEFKRRVLHDKVKFSKTANLKYVHLVSSLLEKVDWTYKES